MSFGKMVISTNRAAIPDMFTSVDGSLCGMLVEERSVDDVRDAIIWCQEHCEEADMMCQKAYEKVCTFYSMDVILQKDSELYRLLLSI